MRKSIQTLSRAKRLALLTGFILLGLIAMAQLAGGQSTYAAAKPKTTPIAPANGTGNSLRISPTRTDIQIKKGTTGSVSVIITNVSNQRVALQPIENDFTSNGVDGQPALILDPGQYAPSHSLKRFMQPLASFELDPHKSKSIRVNIKVPANAQPGGYFGAIRFKSATITSTKNQPQALIPSVASLILMTVPGPVPEQLALTNFDVQQRGDTSSNFRTPDNLQLLVRFKNEGGIQEAPFGQIQVTKGKDVVYTYDFNQTDPKQEILPDSARRWEVPLQNIGSFGKYTVSGTFGYGNGKSIQVSKSIWIIPTIFIIGALIVIALFIIGMIWLFILLAKRRKKRRNKKSKSRKR